MSSKKLNPFKDFQSDQIQRSSRKIFTAHYACRNAALNLTPVTGTTDGFIFQIINSLIESWGVRLTSFDCKHNPRNKHKGFYYSGNYRNNTAGSRTLQMAGLVEELLGLSSC